MKDAMIDLETHSARSNAAIVSIGAVMFGGSKLGPEFYCTVKRDGQDDKGLHFCPGTAAWWQQQSVEARKALACENAIPADQALGALVGWLQSNGASRLWAHGSSFDCVIIDNAMAAYGIRNPIKFWDYRDTRTIYEIAGIDMKAYRAKGTHHNALDDAKNQARAVQDAMKKLATWRDAARNAAASMGVR